LDAKRVREIILKEKTCGVPVKSMDLGALSQKGRQYHSKQLHKNLNTNDLSLLTHYAILKGIIKPMTARQLRALGVNV
jgi:hypothetical protein